MTRRESMKAAFFAALAFLLPAGEAKAKSRKTPGGIDYTIVEGCPYFYDMLTWFLADETRPTARSQISGPRPNRAADTSLTPVDTRKKIPRATV